jgi:hypothetical protein
MHLSRKTFTPRLIKLLVLVLLQDLLDLSGVLPLRQLALQSPDHLQVAGSVTGPEDSLTFRLHNLSLIHRIPMISEMG